jgi:hypothetical protein
MDAQTTRHCTPPRIIDFKIIKTNLSIKCLNSTSSFIFNNAFAPKDRSHLVISYFFLSDYVLQ